MLHYNYENARAYAKSVGVIFVEEWLPGPDQRMADADFTQEQVDTAMVEYIWQIAYLFKPTTYNWKGRLALAAHFLFGEWK
jgi:hypothetical protein